MLMRLLDEVCDNNSNSMIVKPSSLRCGGPSRVFDRFATPSALLTGATLRLRFYQGLKPISPLKEWAMKELTNTIA